METLLAATAALDRGLTILAALLAAWLLLGLFRKRPAPDDSRPWDGVSVRTEAICLVTILACSAVCRLIALASPLTPAYWDAAVNTLLVDQMMKGPGLRDTLRSLIAPFQGFSYFTHLAALLPLATLLQQVLGPSFELQGYIGAALGLASVFLAWAFGRVHRGPLFGLLFAGFTSVSLAQLLWSRIGGTYLGGIPHVLLVALLGFEAGRRNNVVYGLLGGLVGWLCLYNHYQARVCLPVLYVAVLAGAVRRPRPFRAIVVQGAVVSLVLACIYAKVAHGGFRGTVWPEMGGDVGNQGEATLRELIEKNLGPSTARLRECLKTMFVAYRGLDKVGWGWGLERGGMLLAPAIVFGLVGLLVSLRRMIRELLPLAITFFGLAIAVLSEAQTRKLLIFDLGWNLLATAGLYEVLRHRLLGPRRGARFWLAGGLAYALAAAWGFAAIGVTTLRAGTLDMPFRQFSLSLFGDAFDAPRTFRVAKLWENWMRQGFTVVFVNTDNGSNNFATYGGIAALAAGRTRYFQPFYPLDSSSTLPHGDLFENFGRDRPAPALLGPLVAPPGARGTVWWFERPTRFDQWLIEQLTAPGGTAERWPPGMDDPRWAMSSYVVLEGPAVAGALDALTVLDLRHDGGGDLCLELAKIETRRLPSPTVNAVVRVPSEGTAGTWATIANEGVYSGDRLERTANRAIAASPADGDGLAVLDEHGLEIRISAAPPEGLRIAGMRAPPGIQIGRVGANCAARVGDDWWVVDPVRGSLHGPSPTDWLPARPWAGIAADGTGHLILASADQHLTVARPATREIERTFPAHVWESFRLFDFGSCSVIRSLDGYVASFALNNSLVALYTMSGEEVSTLRLTDAMPDTFALGVTAIDVADAQLVVTSVLGMPVARIMSYAISPQRPGCEKRVRLTPAAR